MSTSAVVAIVISSLAALLAAFFGLSAPSSDVTRVLRIGSFGFACPIAVFLGVGIRSHNWISPPLEKQISDWTNAGYTPEQARAFVAFRQLGLVPEGLKVSEIPKSVSSSGLFAAPSADDPVLAECERLASSRFTRTDERLNAMRSAGGRWSVLAESVAGFKPEQSAPIVDAAYMLVCH
jgi:hypothetical protein